MATIIIVISIMIQLSSAVYALTLVSYTGKKTGWILISTALFMMAGRRSITLYDIVTGTKLTTTNLSAEVMALSISIFIFMGLILIRPLLVKITTTEQKIKDSNSKYQQLHDTAFEGILILNSDFVITENNPSSEKIFSLTSGRLKGRSLLALIPNKYHERIKNELEYIQNSTNTQPELFKKNIEGIRNSTETFPMDLILSSFNVDNKKQITVTIRDTSEVIKAREDLKSSKQMLQTILDTIPVRVFWKDINLNYLGCNIHFAKDAGFNSVEEIIGKDDFQMGWRKNAKLYRADDKAVMQDNITKLNYEEPLIEDGEKNWIRTSKIPLKDSDGNIYGVMGAYENITDRKKIETDLIHTDELLRKAQEIAQLGHWELDVDTNIFTSYKQSCEIFGLEGKEGCEGSFEEFLDMTIPEDEKEQVSTLFKQAIKDKSPVSIDHRVKSSNRFVHEEAEVIIDKKGKTTKLIGIVQDITERKRIEEELLKAHKLESLGILAGGIAHDFNNLLTAIIGNLFFLKGNNSDPDDIKHIKTIEGASLRAQDLTKQLMTFSRGGSPIKDSVSIKELLIESANFALHGSKISYDHDIPDTTDHINADHGQISQVLNNLLINALQAMDDGGTIHVTANNIAITRPSRLFLKNGDYVKISISDTGAGISTDVQEKIFDPFFTTKEGGSGLGLASCYSIVKKHSGNITVDSTLGKGTTFNLYLPALKEDTKTNNLSKDLLEPQIENGTGNILIMDDDNDLRALYKGILETLGYTITLTSEGKDTIKKYTENLNSNTPFDLIIMDLTIPGGMGGKDTIKEILEIDKNANAIVSSGYCNDPIMANYKDYGFKGKIEKPFSTVTLSVEVKNALKSKSSS